MTPEHKQQAKQLIADWTNVSRTSTPAVWFLNADCMAGFLQELVDAPEPEPVARVTGYYAGYLSIATVDGRVLPTGTALYTAPPAPSVPDMPLSMEQFGGLVGLARDDASEKAIVYKATNIYGETCYFGVKSTAQAWAKSGRVDEVRLRELRVVATPPTPSVPDGWRSAIAKEFPLYDEDGLDEDKHCCEWVMLQERKRLHKILAAPTPAEAPADVARDAERLRLFEQWTEMGYEHTKEPWFEVETESDVIEITNDERNGAIVPIAEVSTGFNGRIGIEQEANARRIVACVNACAGIPTEVLEQMPVGPSALEQQRDKLLAALTEIAELDILKHHHAYAIAKGAIEEIEALK